VEWKLAALSAGIAAAGGLVAYLQKFAVERQAADAASEARPKWSWGVVSVKVLTAAFVGWLTLLLLAKRGIDENLTYFLVALAGYGGAETLEFFKSVAWEALKRVVSGAGAPPSPPQPPPTH
jgi:hypothetical protein